MKLSISSSHVCAIWGENCKFDKYSLHEAIKHQLIEHCYSATLRRRLLREKSSATLNSLIEMARSTESANVKAANKWSAFNRTCSQCGIQHNLGRFAWNEHQPQVVPKVQYVQQYSSYDEKLLILRSRKQVKTDIPVNIEGAPVRVCVDSGATANAIDYATYEAIRAIKVLPLKLRDVRLRTYGEDNPTPIRLAELFFGLVTVPSGQMDTTRFLILKAQNAGYLLSR